MRKKDATLTPHCRKVLEVLHKSAKPLSAYDLLDKLQKSGIKAPPTIYRALETLVKLGRVHRIETINAFVACHDKDEIDHAPDHGAQFAVCRSCGAVEEIHDGGLTQAIKALCQTLKFQVERQMLELMGLCHNCMSRGQ